ncbi:hypothetical protein [Microbacterium sp. NPDC076911]|uniref:hypothetical protein n=1 Tax=Microbacterium sp. NPDC076911 TaxID=3154958 RepID=UPI00343678BC
MTLPVDSDTDGAPTTVRRLRREAWGFAVGSALFFVGALPIYADAVGIVATNVTFFVGSVFFTLAGFIQLSLSGRHVPHAKMNRADRADWFGAAVQFAGTLLFNLSTILALLASIREPDAVGAGWRPDAWGSLAFLISSGFALIATQRRGQLWDTDARTWHGTWLNALGAVAFGVSAVGAYVLPSSGDLLSAFWATAGTAIGAACFFLAAILSRRAIPLT